jgi:hypothetical protein
MNKKVSGVFAKEGFDHLNVKEICEHDNTKMLIARLFKVLAQRDFELC